MHSLLQLSLLSIMKSLNKGCGFQQKSGAAGKDGFKRIHNIDVSDTG